MNGGGAVRRLRVGIQLVALQQGIDLLELVLQDGREEHIVVYHHFFFLLLSLFAARTVRFIYRRPNLVAFFSDAEITERRADQPSVFEGMIDPRAVCAAVLLQATALLALPFRVVIIIVARRPARGAHGNEEDFVCSSTAGVFPRVARPGLQ